MKIVKQEHDTQQKKKKTKYDWLAFINMFFFFPSFRLFKHLRTNFSE